MSNVNKKIIYGGEFLSDKYNNSQNLIPEPYPVYITGNHSQWEITGVVGQTYTIRCYNRLGNERYRLDYTDGQGSVISDVWDDNAHTFTLLHPKFRVIVFDTSLIKDLMLNVGSVALPYQPYHASGHITDGQSEFLKEEFDKSSNLFNYKLFYDSARCNWSFNNDGGLNVTSNAGDWYILSKMFSLPAGIYKLSFTATFGPVVYVYINSTPTRLTVYESGDYQVCTFSLSDVSDVQVRIGGNYIGDCAFYKVILNKGSINLPYQPYSGEVVHKLDLLNVIYPVGAVYMSATDTNPSTFLGGTWSALGVHYVPKNNVPVVTGTTHISGHDASRTVLQFVDAEWASTSNRTGLLQLENGNVCIQNTTSGSHSYGAVPGNLWSNTKNTSYTTAIYLWQRTA